MQLTNVSCSYTVSSQVIIGSSTGAMCVVVTLLVIVAIIGVFKLSRKKKRGIHESYTNDLKKKE